MVFLDFIEVGTSDFDTEIQKDDSKCGVSIEPIKYYLDRLPNKNNCIKLNIGISNYTGKCVVYYLSEKTIQQYGFPAWIRGCNSINSYHKTVNNLCTEKNINIETVIEKDEVDVQTLFQTMNMLNSEGVYFLKIDTEGHDTDILKKFYEDVQDNNNLPHVIMFESNVLTDEQSVNDIIELFTKKGYELISKNDDTILKLNLKKLENKQNFSNEIKKYYIMDLPEDYNVRDLPHENSLEGAKDYCVKHNCSGVTLQDGIYQVRNGKYIKYFNGDVSCWLFL
jgi:FkbM family methyltransferase